MTSHDACTSGTSRVLTVASLQRLKMEALTPAPTDCELWVYDKVFQCTEQYYSQPKQEIKSNGSKIPLLQNTDIQSADRNSWPTVPGLWPHAARRPTHLLQEFSSDLVSCDFHLFLHLKKVLSGQRQHFQNDRLLLLPLGFTTLFNILGHQRRFRHRS